MHNQLASVKRRRRRGRGGGRGRNVVHFLKISSEQSNRSTCPGGEGREEKEGDGMRAGLIGGSLQGGGLLKGEERGSNEGNLIIILEKCYPETKTPLKT